MQNTYDSTFVLMYIIIIAASLYIQHSQWRKCKWCQYKHVKYTCTEYLYTLYKSHCFATKPQAIILFSNGIHFLCQVVEICVCVLWWWHDGCKNILRQSLPGPCSVLNPLYQWQIMSWYNTPHTVCLLLQELLFPHACMHCHTCGSDMIQHQCHVIHALSAIHINMQQLVSPFW